MLLRGDDLAGRHRAGVEEHRDEGQAHRDLVGDHLRARAEPAEQGVRRPAGPAAEHDAVDADRGDRHHEEHGDRHVGQLQGRLDVAERDRDLRAERDHREGDEGRDRGDHRGGEEHHLVGGRGDDVFLQRELHAVGEALQQTERTVDVGADAVLHPGHHAALEPDVEQRQHHQDHEDQHRLEQHQPPGVYAELLEPRRSGAGRDGEHGVDHWSAPFTRTPLPGEARSARTPWPVEFGGHPDRVGRQVGARLGRQRHRPTVTGEGDHRAQRGVRVGRDAADRRTGGGAEVLLAVLHRAAVEHQLPGGEGERAVVGGRRGLGGVGQARPLAVPRAHLGHQATRLGRWCGTRADVRAPRRSRPGRARRAGRWDW